MKIKINVSYYPLLKKQFLLGSDITNGIITTIFFPEFKPSNVPRFYLSFKKYNSFQELIGLIKEYNTSKDTYHGVTEYSIICTGYPTSPIHPYSKKRKNSIISQLDKYIDDLFSGKDIDDYIWNKENESYINVYSHFENQYFWGDNPETTIFEFYKEIPDDGIKKFLLSYISSNFMKSDISSDKANVVCTAHMAVAVGITLKDILPPP